MKKAIEIIRTITVFVLNMMLWTFIVLLLHIIVYPENLGEEHKEIYILVSLSILYGVLGLTQFILTLIRKRKK